MSVDLELYCFDALVILLLFVIILVFPFFFFFFFNDTATTEIYTLSLHDALPILVVQARMSSARLPGKVLLPVAGRPLLGYVLERVAPAREMVIVATSDQPDDDPVAEFASQAGVQVFRGSLADVAGRFAALADSFGLDA